jgi:site-specific DNA recombinase
MEPRALNTGSATTPKGELRCSRTRLNAPPSPVAKEAGDRMTSEERPGRAAVYSRVSTDDQAEFGYSLAEQERRCRELAEREGWHIGEVYVEAGVSGALASRPELDRLMGAVADGKTDVLIVVDLSRLARDAGIMRDILRVLDAAGVRVVASGQALDRKSPEGRLQTGILSEFAEFERRKIGERTKAGIAGRPRGQALGPREMALPERGRWALRAGAGARRGGAQDRPRLHPRRAVVPGRGKPAQP